MSLIPVNKPRKIMLSALGFLIAILAMIILTTAFEQKSLHNRIEAFHTMHIYPATHIWGYELELIYMPQEKDSMAECEATCMENSRCVAVDYYPPNYEAKHSAQCWLFGRIKGKGAEFNMPCCTLAVRNTEQKQIKVLDKRFKEISTIPSENLAHP